MLRITARHADEWNTWGDVDAAATKTTAFLAACEAVGRDPTTMRRSVQAIVFLEDDAATRWPQLRENAPAGRSIVGTPSELVDTIGSVPRPGFRRVHRPRVELRRTTSTNASPSSSAFRTEVATREPPTNRSGALGLIAVFMLPAGIQATFAPRSFFDDFPLGRGWISHTGDAYNEHLVRDVGACFSQ